MKKIKIITDSSSDVTKEIAEKYDIAVLPMSIFIGDKTYKDFYELTREEFFKKLVGTDEKASTSQINISVFYDEFKKWVEQGYSIICYTLSSKGSGTYQSAVNAKNMLQEEMDVDIEIIDSLFFTYIYGKIAVDAAKMVNDGKSKEEIIEDSKKQLAGADVIFVVDTLKYLKRSGRITLTTALIGEVLDIKPVLTVIDGVIDNMRKIRGTKKVIPTIIEIVKEKGCNDDTELYIMYGGNRDRAEVLATEMEKFFNRKNLPFTEIGPTIGVHTGPGVLGVIMFKK